MITKAVLHLIASPGKGPTLRTKKMVEDMSYLAIICIDSMNLVLYYGDTPKRNLWRKEATVCADAKLKIEHFVVRLVVPY